jgi:predicted dinucleotide-binding enzyme
MGSGLARLFAAKGHSVALADQDADAVARLAAEIGDNARGADIASAVKDAEIVILSIPFDAAKTVLEQAGDLDGKILIDITNPITPDYMELTIGHTTSAAEEIAKLAPTARVVKAFNTVFWQALPFEVRRGNPAVQVLMASDDADAKQIVADVVTGLEFEAIDAGPLSNARFIEPVGEMNIHFGYALGWGTAISPAWVRLAA